MNKKHETELTEGSEYKISSIGGRENALETKGIFKGFMPIGVDEIGLLIKLDKSYGDMAGKTRIIPLHAILAIDILKAKPNNKKSSDREAPSYVG